MGLADVAAADDADTHAGDVTNPLKARYCASTASGVAVPLENDDAGGGTMIEVPGSIVTFSSFLPSVKTFSPIGLAANSP